MRTGTCGISKVSLKRGRTQYGKSENSGTSKSPLLAPHLFGVGHPLEYRFPREDFSGIESNSHHADLVQRLDRGIEQLDRGLAYLQCDRPGIKEDDLRMRKANASESGTY